MLIKKIKAALALISALLLTGTVSSCSSENTTSAESDTVTEIITVSNTNEDNISADNALTKKVTAVNYSSGDVTGDGIIDATDASLILTSYAKTSAGGKDEMNDEQKKYADVNKDGVVDAIDASVVLTYYAKSSSGYKESFEAFIQSFNEPSVEETPSGNELQLYAPILDYFYKNISEKWANYKCIDQEYPQYNIKVGTQGANISSLELVSDYIISNIKDKSLDEIGYQFIDINNDGTKELVIAEIWSNSGSLWATVACDLYTIKDNNIVHLAASGPRDRFSVSKNNLIVEEGSGGMYLSSNTYYSLSDGMLKPVKEYKLDQNTFKDTNWHYSDSYVNNSFTNWIISDKNTDNTEFIIFEPTPFSSYSSNSGSNTDTGSANSEITETAGSYKWYIEPSVKADDIMSSDYCGNDNNYETSVISDYSVIKNNDKYGIITYDGDYIYNEIYDNVYYDIGNIIFSNNSSYDRLVVCHDGSTRTDTPWGSGFTKKYFYCNNQIMIGDDIYVPSYDNSAAYEELKNKIVPIQKADISGKQFVNLSKYGLADSEKVLVPFEYDNYYYSELFDGAENNNILPLEKNGKWTYFNKNGEAVVSNCEGIIDSKAYISKYLEQKMYPFNPTDEIIPVKIDGKCGYYDIYGNELVKCGTFEEVRPVHNSKAWVKQNGLWGVIEFE